MIVVSEVCSCLHISTRQSFAPSWWQEEPSFTKLVNVPFSPSLLLYYPCFPLRSFFLAEINWVCKKLAKKPLSIFYTTPVLILAWQTKLPLSPSHWNSTALRLQGNGFTWITWMIFLLRESRESKSSRLSSLHADIHIELGGASVLRLQRLARTLKLGNAWSTWKKLCSTCARMIEIEHDWTSDFVLWFIQYHIVRAKLVVYCTSNNNAIAHRPTLLPILVCDLDHDRNVVRWEVLWRQRGAFTQSFQQWWIKDPCCM